MDFDASLKYPECGPDPFSWCIQAPQISMKLRSQLCKNAQDCLNEPAKKAGCFSASKDARTRRIYLRTAFPVNDFGQCPVSVLLRAIR